MNFVSQTVNKYNGNSVSCFRYEIKNVLVLFEFENLLIMHSVEISTNEEQKQIPKKVHYL